MAVNNILPFCPTTGGSNLLTQSAYAAASDRTNGNQPGIASSQLVNKAIRQATLIASQIGQYIANKTGSDVLDTDGFESTLLTLMNLAFFSWPGIATSVTTTTAISTAAQYYRCTGTFTATLPALASSIGQVYTVKACGTGTNVVTLKGNGSENIDGANTFALNQSSNDSITVFNAAGAVWDII